MASHEQGSGGHGWWLSGAFGVAVASGFGAAGLLMQAQFAAGFALLLLSVVVLRWPRSIWLDDPDAELSQRQRRLLDILLAECVQCGRAPPTLKEFAAHHGCAQ